MFYISVYVLRYNCYKKKKIKKSYNTSHLHTKVLQESISLFYSRTFQPSNHNNGIFEIRMVSVIEYDNVAFERWFKST